MNKKDKKLQPQKGVEINESSLEDVAGGMNLPDLSSKTGSSRGQVFIATPSPDSGEKGWEAYREYLKQFKDAGYDV